MYMHIYIDMHIHAYVFICIHIANKWHAGPARERLLLMPALLGLCVCMRVCKREIEIRLYMHEFIYIHSHTYVFICINIANKWHAGPARQRLLPLPVFLEFFAYTHTHTHSHTHNSSNTVIGNKR